MIRFRHQLSESVQLALMQADRMIENDKSENIHSVGWGRMTERGQEVDGGRSGIIFTVSSKGSQALRMLNTLPISEAIQMQKHLIILAALMTMLITGCAGPDKVVSVRTTSPPEAEKKPLPLRCLVTDFRVAEDIPLEFQPNAANYEIPSSNRMLKKDLNIIRRDLKAGKFASLVSEDQKSVHDFQL